jgi:hypothetical protein
MEKGLEDMNERLEMIKTQRQELVDMLKRIKKGKSLKVRRCSSDQTIHPSFAFFRPLPSPPLPSSPLLSPPLLSSPLLSQVLKDADNDEKNAKEAVRITHTYIRCYICGHSLGACTYPSLQVEDAKKMKQEAKTDEEKIAATQVRRCTRRRCTMRRCT